VPGFMCASSPLRTALRARAARNEVTDIRRRTGSVAGTARDCRFSCLRRLGPRQGAFPSVIWDVPRNGKRGRTNETFW
jgi:hypothetical protein